MSRIARGPGLALLTSDSYAEDLPSKVDELEVAACIEHDVAWMDVGMNQTQCVKARNSFK